MKAKPVKPSDDIPTSLPIIIVETNTGRRKLPEDFKKPVPSMLMRNTGDLRIKVLHRRAMNCLLAHAQMQDRLGIVPGEHGYEIPIADLEKMLGFASNGNRTFVVDLLAELTRINIKFDNEFARGAMNVLAHVVYHKSTHLVTYSIDSVAKSYFLRPERYAKLNIELMRKFTSLAGLMLFEFCCAYATSPGRRTPDYLWTDWSVLISGMKEPHANVREFNKILVRAINQVNMLWQDFRITAHVSKVGGRLHSMYFAISPNRQIALDLDEQPCAVSGPLRDRLAAFGLTHKDIEEMLLVHDEDYLLAQADYLTRRLTRSDAPAVKSPTSFYRKAVEENYAKVAREQDPPITSSKTADKGTPPAATGSALPPLSDREKWWSTKYTEARALIEAMNTEERAILIQRFETEIAGSLPTVVRSIKQHGVNKPVGMAVVSRLLAHSMFTEPDADATA